MSWLNTEHFDNPTRNHLFLTYGVHASKCLVWGCWAGECLPNGGIGGIGNSVVVSGWRGINQWLCNRGINGIRNFVVFSG